MKFLETITHKYWNFRGQFVTAKYEVYETDKEGLFTVTCTWTRANPISGKQIGFLSKKTWKNIESPHAFAVTRTSKLARPKC